MIKLNGQPLSVTHFPDNTSQVWQLPEETFSAKTAEVVWKFSNEAEIMHLAQLQHLLINRNPNIRINLDIKYLPYGRQDKDVSNVSTFALQTFLTIFRTFGFDSIRVRDPHNWDAVRFECPTEAYYPIGEVYHAIEITNSDVLCYPDKGAVSKYSKIYEYHDYVYGNKTRDQLAGNITGYELVGDVKGKNVLIVDDICDGGATFKILTKGLLANGAKSVALFVTHGIFSKGTRTLFDSGIARVFTADGEVTARHNSQNI